MRLWGRREGGGGGDANQCIEKQCFYISFPKINSQTLNVAVNVDGYNSTTCRGRHTN